MPFCISSSSCPSFPIFFAVFQLLFHLFLAKSSCVVNCLEGVREKHEAVVSRRPGPAGYGLRFSFSAAFCTEQDRARRGLTAALCVSVP